MAAAISTPDYSSYVPRVVREWLVADDPGVLHRRIDGTLVFVDVSGFTAMSERLARLGRSGAEEVTGIIDSTFDRLLTDAYARQGTLLKFGGDALLLLFRNEGHQQRAAAAAIEMRRTLRHTGTIDTPAGQVTLRMSVGVHSDCFDFFLVGGSHRELVVAGPAASRVVAIEAAAGAGQILVSDTTAAALPKRNLGKEVDGGTLLRGTVDADQGGVSFLDLDADLSSFVPVALRTTLAADPAAEIRSTVIAFIHFGGIDELVSDQGPLAAAAALDTLVRNVQEAADLSQLCFLGSDIAGNGGKIILTAGVPISLGNDEERMLQGLRQIAERCHQLHVAVGVHSGHVFAAPIGTRFRRTYTVMGDPVNLAARLMARAEPGQIITTERVLAGSRTIFATEELPPFSVKGKKRPVIAHCVGAPAGVKTAISASDLPLVGRDDELKVLLGGLDAARSGSGRLVDIAAEPGAGKSRLLAEVVTEAEGIDVFRAQCRLYQAGTPYFPFRELLRTMLGLAGLGDGEAAEELRRLVGDACPDLLPWLPLIALPMGLAVAETEASAALDERFRKERMERSVVALMERLGIGPAMVTFEDTHWMDDASADLVTAIAEHLDVLPWLVCLTHRPGAGAVVVDDDGTTITMSLEPLDAAASVDLVRVATQDAPLPPHVISELVERADGNPLFLLELLEAAKEGGGLAALPGSIEGLIGARIDGLPGDDRAMLRRLAVLGAGFDKRYMASVLPDAIHGHEDPLLRRLDRFLEVDATGWVTFRHGLVRDVAYEGLPYRQRRQIHSAIADSILATGAPGTEMAALLSVHCFHAGRWPEAWEYSRRAGDQARTVYANTEAARMYERAMAAQKHLDDVGSSELIDVGEALGAVRERAGLFRDASAALGQARSLAAGDGLVSARLMLAESHLAAYQGSYPAALRWITRGLGQIEGRDDVDARIMRVELLAAYGTVRQLQGRPAAAVKWCKRAIATAGDDTRFHRALAQAYATLDWAQVSLGRRTDLQCSTRALELYGEVGNLPGQANVLNNLGMFAYFQGRWDEAADRYRESIDLYRRAGDEVGASFGTANIAEIRSDQGRYQEAERLLDDALPVWRAAGDRHGVAFLHMKLGEVASRQGRFAVADDHFEQARRQYTTIGATADALEVDAAAADSLLARGEAAAAGALARATLAAAAGNDGGSMQEAMLLRVIGLAAAVSGDLDGAARSLAESLAVAESQDAPKEVALSTRALAHLEAAGGDVERAEELDAAGAQLLERLGVVALPELPPIPQLVLS